MAADRPTRVRPRASVELMTMRPFRVLQRLLTRTLPAGAAASLVVTGLVTPAQSTDPTPPVAEKVQTLASERVGRGWQKSVDTGQPTELVGFRWEGTAGGAVEIRSRAADGTWSEWTLVDGDPLEGPDLGSRERRGDTTAGPVWVGRGVRRVEVRVAEGELQGLKLHSLHPEEPKKAGGTRPAGGALQPGIVSRAAWGADESWRTVGTGCDGTPDYAPSLNFSVVHHTVNSNAYTAADSPAMMRAIYYFHTNTNKWCDIGYNFVVDRFGTVFEGRFGGIDRPVIGAHAQGFNTGSTGVAVLGTFTSAPVPAAAYASLRDLLAWKLQLHGVDPRATTSVGGLNLSTISGHRDVGSTECPGSSLYDLLPQLRDDAADATAAPAYAFVSAASAKWMDVSGGSTSPGAGIIQWPQNGGDNQKWNLTQLSDDIYRIASVRSGLVLDIDGGSTAPGAQVIQWPWHGGTNQQWRLIPIGGTDRFQVASVRSGLVLDVAGGSGADGARLIQWPWQGGMNQQWARPQV